MRIVSGGKWTCDGRWVVITDGDAIVHDPPGLYGHGYDLRERAITMRGDGPHIDWAKEPDMKGEGEFTAYDGFASLYECQQYLREHPDD